MGGSILVAGLGFPLAGHLEESPFPSPLSLAPARRRPSAPLPAAQPIATIWPALPPDQASGLRQGLAQALPPRSSTDQLEARLHHSFSLPWASLGWTHGLGASSYRVGDDGGVSSAARGGTHSAERRQDGGLRDGLTRSSEPCPSREPSSAAAGRWAFCQARARVRRFRPLPWRRWRTERHGIARPGCAVGYDPPAGWGRGQDGSAPTPGVPSRAPPGMPEPAARPPPG